MPPSKATSPVMIVNSRNPASRPAPSSFPAPGSVNSRSRSPSSQRREAFHTRISTTDPTTVKTNAPTGVKPIRFTALAASSEPPMRMNTIASMRIKVIGKRRMRKARLGLAEGAEVPIRRD